MLVIRQLARVARAILRRLDVWGRINYRIHGSYTRVAIIGWIGAFNLGDELMLQTTLSYLKRMLGKVTLVTCKSTMTQLERYSGYEAVSREPLTRESIQYIADNNEALLVNGGALIDDRWYNSNKTLFNDIVNLSKEFISRGKKVIYYGVSCNNKLTNKRAIGDLVKIVNNTTFFTVRDKHSREVISKLNGVQLEKVKLVDDIVFANQRAIKKAKENENWRKNIIETVGIIPVLTSESLPYYRQLVSELISVGKQVRFILFCDHKDDELNLINDLKKDLGMNTINQSDIACPANIEQLRHELQKVDALISARYHSSLIANCMGVPMVCLNYNKHPHYGNKNSYLLKNYGFNCHMVNMSDLGKRTDINKILGEMRRSRVNTNKIYHQAKYDLKMMIKKLYSS